MKKVNIATFVKPIATMLLAFVMCLSITACGTSESNDANDSNDAVTAEENVSDSGTTTSEGKALVAYFSWADNAVTDSNTDAIASPSVMAPGNVQELASWVQEGTGADIFSIQVEDKYSDDWDECLDRANQERAEDARPALTASVENIDQYDTIFIGYPNWWYGVPMPLLTFFEENDLSGKQVYLFCSHGTGGLAQSVDIITEALPDSTISENVFDCYEQDASSSQQDIESWLSELGY